MSDQSEATAANHSMEYNALQDLLGIWEGHLGWNIIAKPVPDPGTHQSHLFELEVEAYRETLTFTEPPEGIHFPILNSGYPNDQTVGAVLYEQVIYGTEGDKEPLHVENGMWLTFDQDPRFTLARQASVPHGNAVIAMGRVNTSSGPPVIPVLNAFPQDVGPDAPTDFLEAYTSFQSDIIDLTDVNKVLKTVLEHQEISRTIALDLSTKEAGGILNIPFLTENKPNMRNRAGATAMQSTFWIETTGKGTMQLQYSQLVDLQFIAKFGAPGLITWPHISLNTLQKVS